jgi:hypothetical protein
MGRPTSCAIRGAKTRATGSFKTKTKDQRSKQLRRAAPCFFGNLTPELAAGSSFYLYIYMPNPLFQTLGTTAVIFFDLHKAPAHFRGAANIIPKLHPRHYKFNLQNFDSDFKTSSQNYPPKSR